MIRATKYRRAALDELRAAVRFHENELPGRGVRLRTTVREHISMLANSELTGVVIHTFADGQKIYRLSVRKSPYGIVYLVDNNEIVILSIAHAKRRPGYWLSRVK